MWNWIRCHILGDHDWTCAAGEGIPPTPEQVKNGVEGFYDYAKMYCKLCRRVYERNTTNGHKDSNTKNAQ